MSAQVEFSFTARCRADATRVMSILDDVDRWPTWARPILVAAQWERWGEGNLGGPGAIRRLGAWPVWIRELIVTRDSRGHTYTVISPAMFSHYLGTVSIDDRPGGGVDVLWRVEFVARRSMLTPVLKIALERTISGLLRRLVAVAEWQGQTREVDSPHS
ncbi:SRPBCC family protein [Mycobacteroides abscessus]|uniref:SRPBCC family protein n=1 Tax=Mycobacteroides abscessus TaxID=36809 RepID=UPI000D97CA5B|nr:SRPBCC family protein [Mycobacteroides abscessus]SPX87971.1 polyketide cyclase [Mycobacteroides abscessus]